MAQLLTRRAVQGTLVALLGAGFVSCSPSEFVVTQQEPRELDDASFGLVLAPEECRPPLRLAAGWRHRRCRPQQYPVSALDDALHALVEARDGRNNLVIFLHGMGDYPQKARREQALDLIEREYNAKTIMFLWPSWVDLRTIPRANAIASGQPFGRFLAELDRRGPQLAEVWQRRVLLVHSLGAEVFKGFVEDHGRDLSPDLFDAVIIAAPEVDLAGHAAWVQRIDFARRVYVVVNGHDHVLAVAKRHLNEARLGMQLEHLDGDAEPLADNATYIVTDGATQWHRYYIERRSAGLAALFQMMVEDPVKALDSRYVELMRSPNVYVVVE